MALGSACPDSTDLAAPTDATAATISPMTAPAEPCRAPRDLLEEDPHSSAIFALLALQHEVDAHSAEWLRAFEMSAQTPSLQGEAPLGEIGRAHV